MSDERAGEGSSPSVRSILGAVSSCGGGRGRGETIGGLEGETCACEKSLRVGSIDGPTDVKVSARFRLVAATGSCTLTGFVGYVNGVVLYASPSTGCEPRGEPNMLPRFRRMRQSKKATTRAIRKARLAIIAAAMVPAATGACATKEESPAAVPLIDELEVAETAMLVPV